MATQQDTPNLPDLQTILAGLGTLGAGVLGVLKWLDTRKSSKKEDKTKREDWLIDNAFEIVSQLRTELERTRKELQNLKAENNQLYTDKQDLYKRIRYLETVVANNGLAVPEPEKPKPKPRPHKEESTDE